MVQNLKDCAEVTRVSFINDAIVRLTKKKKRKVRKSRCKIMIVTYLCECSS